MSSMNFVKMVGTGNDFIVIDNRNKVFPACDESLITRICNRREGIGSDGVILIEESFSNDFKMRIINPDGSEVDMCGNGARCAVRYAYILGIMRDSCTVETLAGTLEASFLDNNISLNMGKPKDFRDSFLINYNEKNYEAFFINTGVPHVVIFVENIKNTNVSGFGSFIRHHDFFKPDGTNCNFVEITGDNSIKVRTYERGVEGETYSCGTGTCAAAIISVIKKGLKWKITSTTTSQEILQVNSEISSEDIDKDFYLIGPAEITFKGSFSY